MDDKIKNTIKKIEEELFIAEMSDSYSVTLSEQAATKKKYQKFLDENNLEIIGDSVKEK